MNEPEQKREAELNSEKNKEIEEFVVTRKCQAKNFFIREDLSDRVNKRNDLWPKLNLSKANEKNCLF